MKRNLLLFGFLQLAILAMSLEAQETPLPVRINMPPAEFVSSGATITGTVVVEERTAAGLDGQAVAATLI